MKTGIFDVKGTTTFNGGVSGASQSGQSYLSTYITTTTFTETIPLNKATYKFGMLFISPGYHITGSKSSNVLFTDTIDEESATNCERSYSKAYSKVMGSRMLSRTIFAPSSSELKNVYIDGSDLTLVFTKTVAGTGRFYGNVWWRVFQG